MSDTHSTDAGHVHDSHGTSHDVAGPHGSTDDHGDGHGHDDHGHSDSPLGPIDWTMWAVGVLGVLIALAMTAVLVMSTGFSFSA